MTEPDVKSITRCISNSQTEEVVCVVLIVAMKFAKKNRKLEKV